MGVFGSSSPCLDPDSRGVTPCDSTESPRSPLLLKVVPPEPWAPPISTPVNGYHFYQIVETKPSEKIVLPIGIAEKSS